MAINQSDIIADMHTHTVFSKHAYSTVKENIDSARAHGLRYLIISDHYYGDKVNNEVEQNNEFCRIFYFHDHIDEVVSGENGVRVDATAEFNIGQDIDPRLIKSCFWRPVGLHNWFIDVDNLDVKILLEMFQHKCETGCNAIVHIERGLNSLCGGKYANKYDSYQIHPDVEWFLEKIVRYAVENNIYLEVNEASLKNGDLATKARMEYWLGIANKMNAKIYLGSDAHYCDAVGMFPRAIELLNEIGYRKENILNANDYQLQKLFWDAKYNKK